MKSDSSNGFILAISIANINKEGEDSITSGNTIVVKAK